MVKKRDEKNENENDEATHAATVCITEVFVKSNDIHLKIAIRFCSVGFDFDLIGHQDTGHIFRSFFSLKNPKWKKAHEQTNKRQ